MKRRSSLTIIASLLALLLAHGHSISQVAALNVPAPAVYWLIDADLLLVGSGIATLILLVTTNTRRPRGIEPDEFEVPYVRGSDGTSSPREPHRGNPPQWATQ